MANKSTTQVKAKATILRKNLSCLRANKLRRACTTKPKERFMCPISTHFKSLASGALALFAASALSTSVWANSVGSPVCEVTALPFAPMSSVIGSPEPVGWTLFTTARAYRPGEAIEVRIVNTDPTKRVRGALIWAKFDDFSPAGIFQVGPGNLWQYIPPGPNAQCAQASISHTSSAPKTQAELVFSWTPPAQGDASMRAFLIEDCLLTSCRSFQALTQVLALP
jgi:Reeler domain